MAFDYAGLINVGFSWLRSFLFWGVTLFFFIVVVFGSLVIKKRRKLKFPVLEQTDLGNGKVGLIKLKGGWFKNKNLLFGLWDYGDIDIFKVKDGRVVEEASSEDYHDIFGKRGLIVHRKGDDPVVLIPITKLNLDPESKNAIMSIAPADFRDTSNKIMKNAENETKSKLEKFLPYLVFGSIGIVFLICIILIVQMVKNSQLEASKLILEAGKVKAQQVVTTATSGAP